LTLYLILDTILTTKQKKELKMMKCLEITLSKDIIKDRQKFDDLITIESLRDFILSACDDSPTIVKNALNSQTHSLVSVIYSRPHKEMVRIFGLGENGDLAINSIFVKLSTLSYVKIKNEKYAIKRILINPKIDYLAIDNGINNIYTTLTPINIFNKHNYKIFKGIYHTAFGNDIPVRKDTISKAPQEQKDKFYEEIKKYSLQQIQNFISFYTSSLLSIDRDSLEFIEKLKIEWKDINVIFGKYHSEEMAMPMVTGKFKSNFLLPKFIGYKIGKGFGELSLKTKGANCEF
jgi:hypothetical protein